MTFAQRFLLTLIIVLILLFALAAVGYFSGRWGGDEADAAPQPEKCMDEATREKVRAIMLDGIDAALKDRVMHLFEVWMRDAADRTQPQRAVTGAKQAVAAYVGSRKSALEWSPPAC